MTNYSGTDTWKHELTEADIKKSVKGVVLMPVFLSGFLIFMLVIFFLSKGGNSSVSFIVTVISIFLLVLIFITAHSAYITLKAVKNSQYRIYEDIIDDVDKIYIRNDDPDEDEDGHWEYYVHLRTFGKKRISDADDYPLCRLNDPVYIVTLGEDKPGNGTVYLGIKYRLSSELKDHLHTAGPASGTQSLSRQPQPSVSYDQSSSSPVNTNAQDLSQQLKSPLSYSQGRFSQDNTPHTEHKVRISAGTLISAFSSIQSEDKWSKAGNIIGIIFLIPFLLAGLGLLLSIPSFIRDIHEDGVSGLIFTLIWNAFLFFCLYRLFKKPKKAESFRDKILNSLQDGNYYLVPDKVTGIEFKGRAVEDDVHIVNTENNGSVDLLPLGCAGELGKYKKDGIIYLVKVNGEGFSDKLVYAIPGDYYELSPELASRVEGGSLYAAGSSIPGAYTDVPGTSSIPGANAYVPGTSSIPGANDKFTVRLSYTGEHDLGDFGMKEEYHSFSEGEGVYVIRFFNMDQKADKERTAGLFLKKEYSVPVTMQPHLKSWN